jgi:hypothetical protein
MRRNDALRTAVGFLSVLAALTVMPSHAHATVKAVAVAPSAPSTCDPVTITVSGELSSTCYEIVGATIRGPEALPCARPTPCPFRFQVEITVREPNPLLMLPCAIAPPYTRSFDVGTLAAGDFSVVARERVLPFAPDSTDSIVAESFATAAFTVRADSTCTSALGCYVLGFTPDAQRDSIPPSFCTATAPPGGTACLDIALVNTQPVGGLQTTLEVTSADGSASAGAFVHAVSVDPIGRAAGFQAGWTAVGSSTRIILYSTAGSSIAPGSGPLVRVCYSIAPDTAPQLFRVRDTATIVADPDGEQIPNCPVRFVVPPGTICVGAAGCDVNGDGVSDVLDVIRLVRCALGGGSDSVSACPDSVAARADCNGDGSTDIRDVICCVRKIVRFLARTEPLQLGNAANGENAIGFEGDARWIDAVEGLASVRVDASAGWGGAQFSIDPRGAPVRIRALKLMDAAATDQLEWAVDETGVAHALLYTTADGVLTARTLRVVVALDRLPAGSSSGTLKLADVRAGTSMGVSAPVSTTHAELGVTAATVAAPMLLAARPNPSSGRIEIGFALPADARVVLRVYDVAGRLVRTLIDGSTPAGVHRAAWDGVDSRGRTARSGIYFAKLLVGSRTTSERLMLLR